jgi:glycerate dehydrogenase
MSHTIVVLDGYTLNPGDLSWEGFENLGNLVVYDRTPADKIIERIGTAEIVITNKTPLTAETFGACPTISYVGVLATGYNVVDIQAATEHGVVVTNIPTYGTAAVAQFVFALLLALCHHVESHSQAVKSGRWHTSVDFCFWDYPLVELVGKTFGIIGMGRIGYATAQIAQAFGMKVLAYSRTPNRAWESDSLVYVELDELLATSDVISLHCPLTDATKGLINAKTIAQMKPGVLLINTSRGPIIVEEDLADALKRGHVAGAAVDVITVEPPKGPSPLIDVPNCIVTPHIAWAPYETRIRLMNIAVANLAAFLEGKPVHQVN